MLFENRFIYFPVRYPEGEWDRMSAPARSISPWPRIEDVWLEAEDGVRIHGWYCVPETAQGVVTPGRAILYLHGNAGNVSYRYDQLHLLMFLGCAVLIIDYRGYGRSDGRPSEAGLYRDAYAGWKHLTEDRGFAAEDVFLLGKSLGGALAIELASRPGLKPGGLIVQGAFTSIAAMAKRVMPMVPGFLLRTKMDSLSRIGSVSCPKLIIHGDADEIVPFAMGEALYEAAAEPRRFYRVRGAGHDDIAAVDGKGWLRELAGFMGDFR